MTPSYGSHKKSWGLKLPLTWGRLTFSEGAFPCFSPGSLSHRWPSCWSSWGLSAPAGLRSSAMQIPITSLNLCRPHFLLWNLQCPHACPKEVCLGNLDNCLVVVCLLGQVVNFITHRHKLVILLNIPSFTVISVTKNALCLCLPPSPLHFDHLLF